MNGPLTTYVNGLRKFSLEMLWLSFGFKILQGLVYLG